MKITLNKKNASKFPTRKIRSVVQTVLPKGANFRLRVINSKIGGMKVVRVVTPAWKNLPPSGRILRILTAANKRLSNAEQKGILRFSVLTPDELKLLTNKPSKKVAAHN
jgi:hypothetical protein